MRVEVIVAAAGRSRRLGPGVPKQYLSLGGEPLIRHSLRQFETHPRVENIVVVVDEEAEFRRRVPSGFLKIGAVVRGGEQRQESVFQGLRQVDPASLVLVHDAARPFLSADLISAVIDAAEASGAAVPVQPVTDTPKLLDRRGTIRKTLTRSRVVLAQTPQGFSARLLLEAHEAARHRRIRSTDDASLVERLGHPVTPVPGSADNLKVTTREDLLAAEKFLSRSKADHSAVGAPATGFRTGIGFDQHPLVAGRRLVLGGVEIPFDRGLEGHSDADVLTHAVCDALLGGANLGDLGSWFPDSDPRYRGVRSLDLLEKVALEIGRKDLRVVNLDITVVAEKPLLGPHREAMRRNLAVALDCAEAAVSVKASRSGGLGPVGRGEGIAAWCVALLESRR